MERKDKKLCRYFLEKSLKRNNITGYFNEELVMCDNYKCPANNGKFFSADFDRNIGLCNINASKSELEELLKKRSEEVNKPTSTGVEALQTA